MGAKPNIKKRYVMKICIIGGGWVGCHLAHKLMDNHQITLYEKNNELFNETSYRNQNRLHHGFHYARNFKTRNLCKETFPLFMNDYGFLTKEVKNNLYCVPIDKSNIDYKTYLDIFRDFHHYPIQTKLNGIEGCIETYERYIDFDYAKKFFNEKLKNIIIHKKIKYGELTKLSKKFDLVINATNNEMKDKSINNGFYESTISLLYKKINDIDFGSLTMVDGKLFSIYPYQDDIYTLTDVEHTPFKKLKILNNKKYSINDETIQKKKKLMEEKVQQYFPNFLKCFTYHSYFMSIKSKIKNTSDERYPIITKNGNILNCFTGKIQGFYVIEDYIKNLIK